MLAATLGWVSGGDTVQFALQIALFVTGLAMWGAYSYRIRRVFAHSRSLTPAKVFLELSALGCTITHLIILAMTPPLHEGLAVLGIMAFFGAYAIFEGALLVHGQRKPAFAFVDVAPVSFQQTGPYAFVRHPIYSAYLLGWTVAPLVTGNLLSAGTLAGMLLLYFVAARQEERQFAKSSYSSEYKQYQTRTGMFIPRLPWARNRAGSTSAESTSRAA
jgi:protein-S-isoprenylcysteine O-methyltransferase Ste14